MRIWRSRTTIKINCIVCIGLIVNLTYWSGCGQNVITMPDGTYRVTLGPGDLLTQAFRGSAFEGAKAVLVNTRTNSFSVEFADSERFVRGSFAHGSSGRTISQLVMGTGNESITLNLDEHKQITRIESSSGAAWQRPAQWGNGSQSGTRSNTNFIDANAELLAAVSSMDAGIQPVDATQASGAEATAGGAKQLGSSMDFLAAVLLASFLYAQSFWSTILFLIQVIIAINVLF